MLPEVKGIIWTRQLTTQQFSACGIREGCLCCSNALWLHSSASSRRCMESRGDICPSKPYTLTNIHTDGLGAIFSQSTFSLQWNPLLGVTREGAAGTADGSQVAKALAKSFWFLQEGQGLCGHTTGGLSRSINLGITHFPGDRRTTMISKKAAIENSPWVSLLSVWYC